MNSQHVLPRIEAKCSTFLRFYLGKKFAVIRFLVENIACTGCAEDMENIMLAMDGVDGATIDSGSGIFSIQYDPEELVAKTIIKKVQSLGFKTQILPDKGHINI